MPSGTRLWCSSLPGIVLSCCLGASASAQLPRVQKEATIGCESCGGALQFSRVESLAISERGDFVVVDRDAPLLRQFDAAAKPVWNGGVMGAGPGEYKGIGRAVLLKSGAMIVIDAGGMRITTLSPSHSVTGTLRLERFTTTTASNDAGMALLGAESPRGLFYVARWAGGNLARLDWPFTTGGASFDGASIALAPNGTVAIMPTPSRYAIIRFDSSGARLDDVTRSIERVPYTAEEVAQLEKQRRGRMAQMAEMTGSRTAVSPIGGASASASRALKPHAVSDGLSYDSRGRLWVHTMRGIANSTVFDVFAPTGAFLGSVTLPEASTHFALGGNWLITSGENADGIPTVTRWKVN